MSRTTIRETLSALITRMKSDLIGDPPTPAAPLRRVLAGEVLPGSVPRPFVAVAARDAEPIGTIDGDKLMALSLELMVVVDVVGDTTHATIFDAVGAIDDFFDGMLDDGFVNGAHGFDDRAWTVSYPRSQAGGRVATARAVQRAVVRVGRMNNRMPVGQGSRRDLDAIDIGGADEAARRAVYGDAGAGRANPRLPRRHCAGAA